MSHSRRDFLRTASAATAGLALAAPMLAWTGAAADKPLKILFLGGTGFLGPATVRILKQRGHEVTLFNRGNRDEMFPDLELITGNRIVDIEPGLEPLRDEIEAGRRWDAVIDTASVHTWTENSAALLANAARQYLYISSLSVYADNSVAGQNESAELATMPDAVADEIDRLPYNMQHYGAVKARSEAAARRHFPQTATILRPGLLVGPRDFTHRFTYWPLRIRDGGEVLAPGDPETPVTYIDVRDLAAFLVRCLERRIVGSFNVNGPVEGDLTMAGLLEGCQRATDSEATCAWVDAEFLSANGVNPWSDMPVWIPAVGPYAGFHQRSVAAAEAAGLTTRPVEETVRDTLAWFDEWSAETDEFTYRPGENAPGISREREKTLLEQWKSREAE